MKVFSPAFNDGDVLPRPYTADGDDISPPIQWDGYPQDTEEFALIFHEIGGDKALHWGVYGIPKEVTFLPEGLPMRGVITDPVQVNQMENSFGKLGYTGPGVRNRSESREFLFTVYALNKALKLPAGESLQSLFESMERNIVDSAQMRVKYS